MEEKDKKKNVENRKEGKNLKIIINLTNKQFLVFACLFLIILKPIS